MLKVEFLKPGTTVWFLKHDKVHWGLVDELKFEVKKPVFRNKEPHTSFVEYTVLDEGREDRAFGGLGPSQLFNSKEELLQSL